MTRIVVTRPKTSEAGHNGGNAASIDVCVASGLRRETAKILLGSCNKIRFRARSLCSLLRVDG